MLKQLMVKMYYKYKSRKLNTIGRIYLGKNNKFEESVTLFEGVRVSECTIGRYTYIAHFSRISKANIGAFCSIGPDVLIGLGIHPSRDFVSTHPAFYSPHNSSSISFVRNSKFEESKITTLGNDVWIGARAVILDGVNIGNGAIIGANSVVTKDIPPYAIAVGSPAKVIKYRFSKSEISFITKTKWWNWEVSKIKEYSEFFNCIERFEKKLCVGEKNNE